MLSLFFAFVKAKFINAHGYGHLLNHRDTTETCPPGCSWRLCDCEWEVQPPLHARFLKSHEITTCLLGHMDANRHNISLVCDRNLILNETFTYGVDLKTTVNNNKLEL